MIIFDTDLSLGTPRAEIDDGAALILLLRRLGNQVAAVTTTHGNHDLEPVLQNTARMLAYLDRPDIPLGRGAALPLLEDKAWFADWQAGYGETPPWPLPELPRAVDLIIDTVKQNPNQVTLVAVGPLTNLALAARLAPEIVPLVRMVVTMGGSFNENDTEPEFNAHCDPEAAQIALNAGWPVRTIGLEITNQVMFGRAAFAALPQGHPAVDLLRELAPGWIERVEAQGWSAGGSALHDALAVAAVMDASLFSWQGAEVSVELANKEQRGLTRYRPVPPEQATIQVATAVAATTIYDLIWEALSE
ncbi:MAG: nucleoside hydrolase [Anaerolineales bacterium]|nr:nucleoside hydrolase [Anaerolineales bacterium]